MPIHVAILRPPYPQLILDGRKTIESRLTKTDLVPYNAIRPGERIFIKQTSGPFVAMAIAGEVHFFDRLTPAKVAELKARFNHQVCGDDAFWQWKRDSNFATFIELTKVQPIDRGPRMKPSSGLAWFVLPDALAPRVPAVLPDEPVSGLRRMFDVTLTAGAIRNHYIRVPRKAHEFEAKHYGGKTVAEAGEPITLIMPDGTRIETDLVGNETTQPRGFGMWFRNFLRKTDSEQSCMIRWRGWHPWFMAYHMLPGDVVRFVEHRRGEYGVSFVNRSPD